jgi:hypothetical protein
MESDGEVRFNGNRIGLPRRFVTSPVNRRVHQALVDDRRSRRHLRRGKIGRRKRQFRDTYEIRYMMPIEIRTSARAFRSLAIDLQGDCGVRSLTS